MTLNEQTGTIPSLLACPNCGAVGSLRPIASRLDARKRTTDIEFRCTACNVVIVHTAVPPAAADGV